MSFGINRRAHERWPIQLPALVSSGGQRAVAELHDISLGGAFLVCEAPLPLGSGLRLSFRLPNGMPVSVSGRVVRADPTRRPTGVGVQFYGLDNVTHEILRNYFLSAGATVSAPEAQVEEKFRIETGGIL